MGRYASKILGKEVWLARFEGVERMAWVVELEWKERGRDLRRSLAFNAPRCV
jgi:hypothetical protein